MKTADMAEINIALNKFPGKKVRLIVELLNDKNYHKKHEARISLVKTGIAIIPKIHILLGSPNNMLRMEVAKIVELIASRKSVPSIISLLDDKEFEIRCKSGKSSSGIYQNIK